MTPAAQLSAISERAHRMVQEQAEGVAKRAGGAGRPRTGRAGAARLDRPAAAVPPGHFAKELLPVLTPLAVQELDPPPLLPGQQWYVAAVLAARAPSEPSAERIVVVPVPSPVPPLDQRAGGAGRLPGPAGRRDRRQRGGGASRLRGVGHGRVSHHPRRRRGGAAATPSGDMLHAVEKAVLDRRRRAAVRLTISARPDRRIKQWLADWLHLGPDEVYEIAGPLDAAALMEMANWPGFEDLKNADWPPQPPHDLIGAENLWDAVERPRRAAVPSLRELRSRGAAGRAGRRRPRRGGHQADALSHQRRFADRPRPGPGGPERQGSDRAGRAAGPLRRSPQRPAGRGGWRTPAATSSTASPATRPTARRC